MKMQSLLLGCLLFGENEMLVQKNTVDERANVMATATCPLDMSFDSNLLQQLEFIWIFFSPHLQVQYCPSGQSNSICLTSFCVCVCVCALPMQTQELAKKAMN